MLEISQADDDVGNLDAEVVDVVLHFDRRPAIPQDAHERVAERRVAEVPDMRRFVRVDRGVLDDCLVAFGPIALDDIERLDAAAHARGQECGAIERQVQIPVRRRDDARDAGDGADRLGQFLRDRARRFA